jgi:hypothetical protein
MSYVLVTNLYYKKVNEVVKKHGQSVIMGEPDKVDLSLKGADVVEDKRYPFRKDELYAWKIRINDWEVGTEEDVRMYAERVTKELVKGEFGEKENPVYTDVVEINLV